MYGDRPFAWHSSVYENHLVTLSCSIEFPMSLNRLLCPNALRVRQQYQCALFALRAASGRARIPCAPLPGRASYSRNAQVRYSSGKSTSHKDAFLKALQRGEGYAQEAFVTKNPEQVVSPCAKPCFMGWLLLSERCTGGLCWISCVFRCETWLGF